MIEDLHKEFETFLDQYNFEKSFMSVHIGYKYMNTTICYLKVDKSKEIITVGFNKAYMFDELYAWDYKSKYIRHKYYKTFTKEEKSELKSIIEDSIVATIEHIEQSKILKNIKKRGKRGDITSD